MKLNNVEALRAQQDLARLMELELPIKVSLDLAIISNIVDRQVGNFGKVRDSLFKKYAITTIPGETPNSVRFESQAKGETDEATETLRKDNVGAFAEKFNQLLEANTEELTFKKAQLPADISVKPEMLKSLMDFVEI